MDHGVPTYREIIPDRNVYGIDDGCIGPSGRYVTDYVVTSPECASYCAHAASTLLHCAELKHRMKLDIYERHLHVGDCVLPVSAESWGGAQLPCDEQVESVGEDAGSGAGC